MKEYHGIICRLCLGQEAILSIFGENSTIFNMIEMCCSLVITLDDGLPDKICNDCKETLESFMLFRNNCQENDLILKQTTIKEENNERYTDDDENHDYTDNVTQKEELEQDLNTNNDTKDHLNDLIVDKTINTFKNNTKKKSTKDELIIKKNKNIKDNNKTIDVLLNEDFTIQHGELLIKEEIIETDLIVSDKPTVKLKRKKAKKKILKESKAVCPFCGKVFFAKRFSAHLKIHNVDSAAFTCDYCNKTFSTKCKIKAHIATHVDNSFSCYICGKMIKKYSMPKHIKYVHQKETTTCTICGKSLLQKSLRYHMKAHSGEKKFECKECSYKCVSKTLLKIHIKTHSKEKPFKCSFCDSHFSTPRYKMLHERLHTGETPYQCPCCDKAYAQLCNMKSHFKHNHKEESYDKVYKGLRRPHIATV